MDFHHCRFRETRTGCPLLYDRYNWVDKQEVTGKDGKELPSAINISFGREESED